MARGQRGSQLPVIEGLCQAILWKKYRQDGKPRQQPFMKPFELLAKAISSVIPAKLVPAGFKPGAGIQNCLKILDSGSRFACPE
jgi:hypothetical protein